MEFGLNPFTRPAPDFERRREELDILTRNRADKVYARLKKLYAKYGADNAHETYEKMQRREINVAKDDIALMEELLDKMRAAVEGHEPPELTGLRERLEEPLSWVMQAFEQAVSEAEHSEVDVHEFVQNVADQRLTLAQVPERFLLEDEYFCQSVLETICAQVGGKEIEDANAQQFLPYLKGIALMSVYNALAKRLPDADKDKIFQLLDLTNLEPVGNLGLIMSCGHLNIRGATGGNLGIRMRGGTIVAQTTGQGLGTEMTGGTIKVDSAVGEVGKKMDGGIIYINDGADVTVADDYKFGQIWIAGKRVR